MIHDLHCDLLWYLANSPERTPFDPAAQCSLAQLQAGGVEFQVLAIYTETKPHSTTRAAEQYACYQKLPRLPGLKFALAIENASSLFEEEEPLDLGFSRLGALQTPLYISFTWNTENRFGGGAHTSIGLKEDGEKLLHFLDHRQIAIDFSHTSDALAEDLLTYIDRHQLTIPLLASHSNFRAIQNNPRNLTDEIAQEIIRRGGVIGLNFVRHFVGDKIEDLALHIEHGIKLGAEKALCLGADFFPEQDSDSPLRPFFFEGFRDSSCYPKVLSLIPAPIRSGNLTRYRSSVLGHQHAKPE